MMMQLGRQTMAPRTMCRTLLGTAVMGMVAWIASVGHTDQFRQFTDMDTIDGADESVFPYFGYSGGGPRLPPRVWYINKHGVKKWSRDPKHSSWWLDYVDNELLGDNASLPTESFRDMFRVPFEMYEEILGDMRADGFRDSEDQSKRGKRPAPLELKLLGSLRYLAVACPFDGLRGPSGVSGKTQWRFHRTWIKWFRGKYYDAWVYPPTTDEDINASVDLYTKAGFPGCVSSMDGVHMAWARAPFADRWTYTGTFLCLSPACGFARATG